MVAVPLGLPQRRLRLHSRDTAELSRGVERTITVARTYTLIRRARTRNGTFTGMRIAPRLAVKRDDPVDGICPTMERPREGNGGERDRAMYAKSVDLRLASNVNGAQRAISTRRRLLQ